jgi:hypothetical protein
MEPIFQDAQVIDQDGETISYRKNVHPEETLQWIADNAIQLETGQYQGSSDGCYECENGIPKRNPDKKVILKSDTLAVENESDFTAKEIQELKSTGVTVLLEKKNFSTNKKGFAAIEEFENYIRKNGLRINATKFEELKKIMAETEITKGTIPVLEFDHEKESYIYTDDFVQHCPIEFQIHKDSQVQQADLDTEFEKRNVDFGNGFSTNFKINNKYCCVLVLKHGTDITTTKFDNLAKEIQRTE